MPVDLSDLLDPMRTAVVTSECQNGVLGPRSQLPELATVAHERAVPNLTRLVHGARVAGVQVVHCVFWRRSDNRGGNTNGRLFAAMARQGALAMEPGTELAMPIGELHTS
ncbi:MAG: cysteine hydrolase, partial [Acidimicrobiia bacterium]|nr:cysteine hydrolase [Acidimicrobiia bacterium]